MRTMTRMGGRGGALALAAALALALAGGAGDAAAQDGEELYMDNCAQCHGENGRGAVGYYPPLDGDPFVTAAEQLPIQVVLDGRAINPRTPPMPAFDDLLSDREVAAVVSYIRGAWSNDADAVDAETVAGYRSGEGGGEPSGTGGMPSGWRAEGEEVFMAYCAACHQDGGEGAEDIFPALAGNPLIVGTDGQYLIHLLLTGRGGMPAFQRSLDDDELALVLSYIRSAWGNDASVVTPRMVRELPDPDQEAQPH